MDLNEYFTARKHDRELILPAAEVKLIGTPYGSAPLLYPQLRAKYGIDASDEAIDKAARDTALLVSTDSGSWPLHAVACTGLSTRSGIFGPRLWQTEATSAVGTVDPDLRGSFFTAYLHTYRNNVNLLVRDEYIIRMASALYQTLDAEEGFRKVEQKLKDFYGVSNVVVEDAKVDIEYLSITFKILSADFADLASRLGMNEKDFGLSIRFSTSDVTSSKMRVTPFFVIKGQVLPVKGRRDNPAVEHIKGKTVDMLIDQMAHLTRILEEAEDEVEALGNCDITCIPGCLQRLAEARMPELSRKRVDQYAKELSNGGVTSGSGIDVYLHLMKVIESQTDGGNSLAAYITLSEKASELIGLDFSRFDGPVRIKD